MSGISDDFAKVVIKTGANQADDTAKAELKGAAKELAEQSAKEAAEQTAKRTAMFFKAAAGTAGLGLGGYALFNPKDLGNRVGSIIGDVGAGVASGTGKAIGAGIGSASGSLITSLAESFGITAKQLKMYITIVVILVLVGFTAKLVM
jgi:hypothetical protein